MKYTCVVVTWKFRTWMRETERVAAFFTELGNALNLKDGLPFAMMKGVGFEFYRGYAVLQDHGDPMLFMLVTSRPLDHARLIKLLKSWAPIIAHTKAKVEHPLTAVTKTRRKTNGKEKRKKEKRTSKTR